MKKRLSRLATQTTVQVDILEDLLARLERLEYRLQVVTVTSQPTIDDVNKKRIDVNKILESQSALPNRPSTTPDVTTTTHQNQTRAETQNKSTTNIRAEARVQTIQEMNKPHRSHRVGTSCSIHRRYQPMFAREHRGHSLKHSYLNHEQLWAGYRHYGASRPKYWTP